MIGRPDSAVRGAELSLYERLAEGLRAQPAYLLVFAVCVLFVLSGMGFSVAAAVGRDLQFGLLGFASFVMALLAVLAVVRMVERGLREDRSSPPTETKSSALDESFLLGRVRTPYAGQLPSRLEEREERQLLADLNEWMVVKSDDSEAKSGKRRELHRVYEFKDFDTAFAFMTDVAQKAISNHHPRWQNSWNRVEFWLTTYNLDYQLSRKDEVLARKIEGVWRDFRKRTYS